MAFHVAKHVFVSIGLRQQLLQMDVHMCELSISISRCHVTGPLSIPLSVFTDSTQLIICELILKLFVALLQIVNHPLSLPQLISQLVILGPLLLDDFPQLRAGRTHININDCHIGVPAS